MKRLVSILLLVFGVTTSFAQSSTPDYIQKAKVGLNQYYPQFKDYFEPIFAEYNRLSVNTHNIFYSKIYDNFDTFKEELTTERDKCATILTAIDDLLGDKKFRNSKKQVDSPDGDDLINGIADEIASDIKVQFSRELRESRERLAKSRERLAKEKERLAKEKERLARIKEISARIEEVGGRIDANKDSPKILQEATESLFEIIDINRVKNDPKIQELVKNYIKTGKMIKRSPSPIGQKFIDEYNRITKSK
jgi:hypothetical protein